MAGYGGAQVLRLGSNLVLAHLLFPEAFGLMALVNVFMQGLQMFSDVGIGPAIIQSKRGGDPVFLRTAWTIQICRGLALWLASCALAGPVAQFFAAGDTSALQLARLLPVAGLTALIAGFNSTSLFTLNRKLAMAGLTMLELIPQAASVAVMILLAWVHPGVWALVAGGLAYSLVRLVMSHAMNRGARDRIAWDRSASQELFKFGRWVFASTILSFLATQLDRLVLGKLMTLAELGLYSIGFTFARVAIQTAGRLSSAVLFPLLARHRDDPQRMMKLCLAARRTVLWAGGAIGSAFAIGAPFFFGTLYDPRYAGAGVISQWLAVYVWAWILSATMDRIPLALGRPRELFLANILSLCGLAVATAGYAFFRLPGFVLGLAGGSALAHVFLTLRLPHGRRAMLFQSLRFTAGWTAFALPCVLFLHAMEARATPVAHGVMTLALASTALIAAGIAVLRQVKAAPNPMDGQSALDLALSVSMGSRYFETLKQRSDVLIARLPGTGGRSVIVKLWNRPTLCGALRRLTFTNTGWREWDTLRRLRGAGLGVPEPLAYVRLRDPRARHTEALIMEDLGSCADLTEHMKRLRQAGGEQALRPVEDELIRATRVMLDARLIDTDHRLPNFVVRPDGRAVRLDFEMARRVRHPHRNTREFGLMLGTLLGSYAFMLQPRTDPLTPFAKRLCEAVRAPAAVLAVARRQVEVMLERQRRENGIETKVSLP